MIEAGMALIAACLPTLRTLFADRSLQTLLPRFRSGISLESFSAQLNWFSNDVGSIKTSKDLERISESREIAHHMYVGGITGSDIELRLFPNLEEIYVRQEVTLTCHGQSH